MEHQQGRAAVAAAEAARRDDLAGAAEDGGEGGAGKGRGRGCWEGVLTDAGNYNLLGLHDRLDGACGSMWNRLSLGPFCEGGRTKQGVPVGLGFFFSVTIRIQAWSRA